MSSGSDSEAPTRQLAIDLGLDLSKSFSFSCNWSGIDLFVDLPISASPTNVETLGASLSRDTPQQSDLQNCCHEPNNVEKPGTPLHDTEVLRNPPLLNDKDDNQDWGIGAEPDRKITTHRDPYGWPDWGEPLPPVESPIHIDNQDQIDYDVVEKDDVIKKVTFSDVVTFAEAGNLQAERETGVLCYVDLRVDQVTSNPADVSTLPSSSTEKELFNADDVTAACQLVELSNLQECGDSRERDSEGVSRGEGECQCYDPSDDLERLSRLVENIYAALPQLSILASKRGRDLREDAGTWTIDVSEDSRRIRMKRIMLEQGFEGKSFSSREHDSDSEVLERPPWKRKYKSFRSFF